MLNEEVKAIALLAREIATAAFQPDAPDDLGVIASDLAVVPNVLLRPPGNAETVQHAVLVARIMFEMLRAAEDEWYRADAGDGASFPAVDETALHTPPRRRARRLGYERIMHRSDQITVRGEDRDEVSIGALVYDNGTKVVALCPDAARGRYRACLLSSGAAREAAAALLAAADVLEAADKP